MPTPPKRSQIRRRDEAARSAACNTAPAHLAFLGRITSEKGPETAIQLARAAGMPLKLAAKIGRAERSYFAQRIKPLIDGREVKFVGEIDKARNQSSWETPLRYCSRSVGRSHSVSS